MLKFDGVGKGRHHYHINMINSKIFHKEMFMTASFEIPERERESQPIYSAVDKWSPSCQMRPITQLGDPTCMQSGKKIFSASILFSKQNRLPFCAWHYPDFHTLSMICLFHN